VVSIVSKFLNRKAQLNKDKGKVYAIVENANVVGEKDAIPGNLDKRK